MSAAGINPLHAGEVLQCSPVWCNLHDWQINVLGVCLRADARIRSSEESYQRAVPDREITGDFVALSETLERIERSIGERREGTPQEPPRVYRRDRKGGTPL